MSNKLVKKACVVAAASMLPLSAMAGEVSISGWLNEGMIFYDDGAGSDAVVHSDNGVTLGSRITFSGSQDLPNGWTAGFDITLEPQGSAGTQPIFTNQNDVFDNSTNLLTATTTLGRSIYVSGGWGKVTVGLQSTPTDNIAVLADPTLTLWDSIGVVFRGNGFSLRNSTGGGTWGTFLQCQNLGGAGIGLDCNGIYREAIRYDLPAFGPVSVAVSYANDDIYDIAAKYRGQLGRITTNLDMGYTINQGVTAAGTTGVYDEAEIFQVQLGLMDPETGLFGTVAYQNEDAEGEGLPVTAQDDSDVYWFKAGIKREWFSPGATVLAGQYGSYNDQYGTTAGVTGSEVERYGFSVNQYFGGGLLLYGAYETMELDVDGTTAFDGAEDLDLFSLGLTYFF